jgi:MFS family permease
LTTSTVSQNEPTTIEKMRGLPWSIAGDVANTFFVQFTFFGSVFVLFLDALGLGKSQIGVLLSFFPFAGLIALLIAPRVARFGYKRTFLTFWGVRKLVTAFLLLTPWVLAKFGTPATILYVGLIVAAFALCRATAETGKYPWTQEYVPNHVRGKYSALSNLSTTLVGIVAVAVAGFVIERTADLSGFMWLIAAGVLLGLVGVWMYSFIPGGTAVSDPATTGRRDLREAVRDRNFRNYLLGIALMTVGTVPTVSFLPLFMQEEVGLPNSQVVLLQNGTLIGGLIFVYIWGWAADRYGSVPVMTSGVLMRVFLPIFWVLMPQNSPSSLAVAMGIAFFQGVANMGWGIGSARLLFVSVVPTAKKTDYMALYYAWIGVVGGMSQLVGGWVIDASQSLSGQWLGIQFTPYFPLFVLGFILPLLSLRLFAGVQADGHVSMGTFAGFMLRGNPFRAVESMIRYHLAKDEATVVLMTERLGQAKSLLPAEELLNSLADPRFNVRFEAIVAIGRTRPDEQFIQALAEVLHSSDPALSVMAAWALGRMGDERAREPLYEGLDSDFRSVRAHSARSLGTLGDDAAIPTLLARLDGELDQGLRIAYASALGQLQSTAAVTPLLQLLAAERDAMLRLELALALARLVGEEHIFIQLSRQVRADPGTALAQAILALARKRPSEGDAENLLTDVAKAFSTGDLDQGVAGFGRFLRALSPIPQPQQTILQECMARLNEFGASRLEYTLLALHVLGTEV